jgi:hypothetical protein
MSKLPLYFKKSIMLSEKAIRVLSVQQYRPDSNWEVNIVPFGSIYWTDEWPENILAELFEQPGDMSMIHSMFGMRIRLWNGEALNSQDQQLWDRVHGQVPS